jgi:hypothetical protein
MGKIRTRRTTKEVTLPTPFDEARDELFQHIMRCGVIGSDNEHVTDWFNETMGYVADRYHELTERELAELRVLGERFVQPPKVSAHAVTAGSAA